MKLPIRTQRLELRDFQAADCAAMHEYRSDPNVTRFMFFGPDTGDDTKEYLHSILETQLAEPRQIWELAVVDTARSCVIGGCDLTLESSLEADLGYILARYVWGNGYGTEIARALVERGFSDLGLRRIFATCDPENHASHRVLEKAGLVFESNLIRHKYAKGRWWNSELHALTRDQWSAAAHGNA